MKKILITFISFFLFSGYINASEADTLWNKANDAYGDGNYQQAIDLYNQILNSGVESEKLYYNLGNAYFKVDSLSKSIINYNRALKLSPSDEDILHNLEVASARTVNRIEEVPVFFVVDWLDMFRQMFSSDTWAIISIIAFTLMLLCAVIYLLSNTVVKRKISFSLCVTSLILFICSLTMSISLKNRKIDSSEAIVVSTAAPVKSSPDRNGKDLFILNEGAKVKVRETINGYSEVVIASGNRGWILSSAIEVI